MRDADKVNILLVDDQPAKLLSYESILAGLGQNLIKAQSAREAFEQLLKSEIAVLLVDVCMPELDGFELARLIREHPRFQKTAIIFISAVNLADVDRLRAYEMGAVDYVPVPVIPEVLRAKVNVFVDLYRKTRQLELLNEELEHRVAERTAELEASNQRLLQSEARRSMALLAGQMGSWDWDVSNPVPVVDEGQLRIFGVEDRNFDLRPENIATLFETGEWDRLRKAVSELTPRSSVLQLEFRIRRPDEQARWCLVQAAGAFNGEGKLVRLSGVSMDITERKEAEERQALLAQEVDHRAKNALAVVQSVVRLTRADNVHDYVEAVEGRIQALARAHTLLASSRWQGADVRRLVEEELAPYRTKEPGRVVTAGPSVVLHPPAPQAIMMAVHELATNAAKYGALSVASGKVALTWRVADGGVMLEWVESGGPRVSAPASQGFGLRVIRSSIESQLAGRAEFNWKTDGLSCQLFIPFDPVRDAAAGAQSTGNGAHERGQKCSRIMLIEDETLVALMTAEYLTSTGFAVVGPFGTVAEAMADAREGVVDAAVLDVNLGGEFVYPIAQLLAERAVPFVFVTGYGSESIDPRFAHVPILRKPIEFDDLRAALVALRPQSRAGIRVVSG